MKAEELNVSFKLAPPPFRAQTLRKIKIRCIAGSAENVAILMSDLAALVGALATTSTTSNLISPLVKLNRISMWAPVASAGTSVTVNLSYVNMDQDFESPPTLFSDSSVSFDRPAHLSVAPPSGGLSAKWHGSDLTHNIVNLQYPIGTVVDFDLMFLLMDNGSNFNSIAGPALVAATVGQIYHFPINSLAAQSVNGSAS
jgi:hypothetical protein